MTLNTVLLGPPPALPSSSPSATFAADSLACSPTAARYLRVRSGLALHWRPRAEAGLSSNALQALPPPNPPSLPPPPPPPPLRVWVYTLVNTDYDGSKLLPHFFNYYHGLGVTWRRFLVLLHHTPGKYSRKGLEDAMGICSGYAVECR